MYSDEELSALYPKDYYAYQDNFRPLAWKQFLKRVAAFKLETKDPRFERPGTILDIGCGSGWYLHKLRDQGWDTYGVEISAQAAELGCREGLKIHQGTLTTAGFDDSFFDYIRLNHSFEHISSPGEILNEIHRILKPSGKLMIGVPNIDGLNARWFGKYWWYLGIPVHTFHYSMRTLPALLDKHGFCVERSLYNSDYSGVLGSLQIFLNRKNGLRSSQGAWISNPALKLFTHWWAKVLDLFNLGDAIEITAVKHPLRVR